MYFDFLFLQYFIYSSVNSSSQLYTLSCDCLLYLSSNLLINLFIWLSIYFFNHSNDLYLLVVFTIFQFRAFIDADKKSYVKYLKTILGETSVSSVDIDRNTKNMGSKVDGIIKNKADIELNGDEDDINSFCLLSDGALIIADNTLWKGMVLSQVRHNKDFNLFRILFYFHSNISVLIFCCSTIICPYFFILTWSGQY